MKNKKLISIICCASGMCMLAVCAAAGYKTANGYDALKKSLLATQNLTNCTINACCIVSVDGTETMSGSMLSEADLENKMRHSMNITCFGGYENCLDNYYYNDSWYYNYMNASDVYIKSDFDQNINSENLWGIDEDDRGTVDKILTFAELAADTVVGDLRNNFVCTEDSGYYTSYRVSLDSVQIPELINAGLSVLFSMSNDTANYATAIDENGNEYSIAEDEDNIYYYTALIGDDPAVDSVALDYTLDKSGSFHDGTAVVIFKGNGHEIQFDISARLDNIGTTHIQTLEEQGDNIKIVSGTDADQIESAIKESTEE